MKLKLLSLLFCLSVFSAAITAQPADSVATYKAYASRNFTVFATLIQSMESKPNLTIQQQLKLLSLYYCYIGHNIDVKQNDRAAIYLKAAMKRADSLKKGNVSNAYFQALYSTLIGFEIALTPLKATYEVSGMLKTANKALRLAPEIPFTNVVRANILFYFPEVFGGDKFKAIEYYKKAYLLMKDNPQYNTNNWMYLNLMSTLAVAYEKTGNLQKAKAMAETSLKAEPDFMFVKSVLYPRILAEMK